MVVRTRESDASSKGNGKKRRLDERLDEGLKETFPASDPVAVTPLANGPSPGRRKRAGKKPMA